MGERLKGRSAVVTGGAGGIGSHICLALAAEGAKLVVNDVGAARDGSGVTLEPADNVVAEIKKRGGVAIANYDSVADFAGAEKLIKTCLDNFGRIDILVNTHGNLRDRMIWNMTEDEWDSVINIHLKGTFNTCRHACVRMREQRYGRIINVTSTAWRGTVGHVNYGAAKGGVVSLTRAIAREMGRYGVTANCFDPSAKTRMTFNEEVKAGFKKRLDKELITKEQYEQLMKMPGPEHIPPIIVYLATEEAGNINGQVFHCEQGRIGLYSEPIEAKTIFNEGQVWSLDELADLVPKTLLVGYTNPAPPEAPKK
jgi:NAD(P)-dependent dehydrogenase (short-subunit alcohol dehydrogenase family)